MYLLIMYKIHIDVMVLLELQYHARERRWGVGSTPVHTDSKLEYARRRHYISYTWSEMIIDESKL